jgi:hypothetical protein
MEVQLEGLVRHAYGVTVDIYRDLSESTPDPSISWVTRK